MPGRTTPLISGYYYHIFNRGIASQTIFNGKKDYSRFLDAISYYRYQNFPGSFSKFKKLSKDQKKIILSKLIKGGQVFVDIICFCLMPNHFHLLLKQAENEGISKFLSNLQNSYTRYFNEKYERTGPVLQGKFKSVLIQTENQLLHLSRYIHLNPYSSAIVKNQVELENYFWSSLSEYLKNTKNLCQKEVIMTSFEKKEQYKNFVFDQKDYQKELEKIKHLIKE